MPDTIFIPIVIACGIFLSGYGAGGALLCALDRRRTLSNGIFILFSLGLGLGILAHLALLMGLMGLTRASGCLLAGALLTAIPQVAAPALAQIRSALRNTQSKIFGPHCASISATDNAAKAGASPGSADVLVRNDDPSKRRLFAGEDARAPSAFAGEDARAPSGFAGEDARTPSGFALAICLLVAGAIILISSLAPPVDYDVLEYHIAGPARWLRLGKIGAFPGNIYANMPCETEMLYMAAMSATGWIAPAMAQHAPGVLHWLFGAGALAVAWAIMRRLGVGAIIRLLVLLLLALHPVIFMVAGNAYIDLAVMFWVGLAILVFVVPFVVPPLGGACSPFVVPPLGGACSPRFSRPRGTNSTQNSDESNESSGHLKMELQAPPKGGTTNKQACLCFVFLGLAVCAKLTAATLYVLPAFLILIPAMVLRLNGADKKNWIPCALKLGLLAAAILGAIYLPWAARAWLSTGNPFFPALSGVYHNPFWAPEQTQRWLICHQQTEFWRADYWSSLAKRVHQPGYWVLLPCLLVFLSNRRDGRRALALYAAAAYALWCLAHGSADRFILPALMAAAPVSAAVLSEALERRRWIVLALWGALALTAYPGFKMDMFRFGYLKPWTALPDSASSRIWQAQHVQGAPQGARAALWANENLPRGAKLLLVYEARFALFDRDCEGNTIFDRSALLDALESEPSATPAEIRDTLRRKGFTHVLINDNDLHLFTQMYLGRYMKKILAPSQETSIPTSEPQALNSEPRTTNHEPRITNPEPRTPNPDEKGLRPSAFIYRLPDPRPEDFYIPFMTDPRYPALRKALLQFLGECRQNASHVELSNRGQGIVWIYDLRSTIYD